jgi:uncharacterized protein
MEKSKVYFIDFHTSPQQNMYKKLTRLLEKAGMLSIDFSKKLVAIKIHFGEPGNLAYIRPNYAAVVVKMLQNKDGLVFLTDANTLYKGRRSNAVDHLQSAMENGFNPIALGCNVVIADGLKGTDCREIEIDLKHCKTAKIGTAIADSDVLISLNHFKGHEMTGFGGCLKNIGMGSGSVGGKLEMHSNSKPIVSADKCTACKVCEKNCAHDAIHVQNKKAGINYEKCVGCGQCVAVCQYDAVQVQWEAAKMMEKMAEYAYAVLKDKPAFHINFLMDISPDCDCWNFNNIPISPNIGILASSDPIAIDKASADLVNNSGLNPGIDKFKEAHPKTDWRICLDYAEKLGFGTQQYELIKIV